MRLIHFILPLMTGAFIACRTPNTATTESRRSEEKPLTQEASAPSQEGETGLDLVSQVQAIKKKYNKNKNADEALSQLYSLMRGSIETTCKADFQCKLLRYGYWPCKGQSRYREGLAYSNVKSAALLRDAQDLYEEIDKTAHKKSVGACVEIPMKTKCASNICIIVAPRSH